MDSYLCKLCGGYLNSEIAHIYNVPEQTFEFSDKTLDLHVAECQTCGCVQLVDVPISENWSTTYRSIGSMGKYREHFKEIIKDFLKKYSLFLKKYYLYDVLEAGCGNGQILDILKEIDVYAEGWEGGKQNIKECIDKGYKVYEYDKDPDKLYDAILCVYVLEHHPDPAKFIKKLYKHLMEDGCVFIQVPNYDYIEEHNLWLEFTRDHRFYFRKRSLTYLLTSVGFDIEEIKESEVDLTIIARKPIKKGFHEIINKMETDIEVFNNMVEPFDDYVVVGAGHYTQLLLNQVKKLPSQIFDTVPAKIGNKLCGITIQNQSEIVNCNLKNIIISCGAYNQLAKENIEKLVTGRNILLWD